MSESGIDRAQAIAALAAEADRRREVDSRSRYLPGLGRACEVIRSIPALDARPSEAWPIELTAEQERACKAWAADDRLWTTQETVEINLRAFAQTIIRDSILTLTAAPEPLRVLENIRMLAARGRTFGHNATPQTPEKMVSKKDEALDRILKLCADAGVTGSILREAVPDSPSQGHAPESVEGKFGPMGNMQGTDHPWRK